MPLVQAGRPPSAGSGKRTDASVAMWAAPLFVAVSGMDIITSWLYQPAHEYQLGQHIDWSSELFQYSSMSSLVCWVPHHALPGWLGAAIFLQLKDDRNLYQNGLLLGGCLALWSFFSALGVAILFIAYFILRPRFVLAALLVPNPGVARTTAEDDPHATQASARTRSAPAQKVTRPAHSTRQPPSPANSAPAPHATQASTKPAHRQPPSLANSAPAQATTEVAPHSAPPAGWLQSRVTQTILLLAKQSGGLVLAVVVLLFITSSNLAIQHGLFATELTEQGAWLKYLGVLLVEFGLVGAGAWWLSHDAHHRRLLLAVCIALALIPLYKVGQAHDLAMRASVPALFVFWCLVLGSCFQYWQSQAAPRGKPKRRQLQPAPQGKSATARQSQPAARHSKRTAAPLPQPAPRGKSATARQSQSARRGKRMTAATPAGAPPPRWQQPRHPRAAQPVLAAITLALLLGMATPFMELYRSVSQYRIAIPPIAQVFAVARSEGWYVSAQYVGTQHSWLFRYLAPREFDRDNPDFIRQSTAVSLVQNQPEQALTYARRDVALNPNDPQAWFEQATALMRTDNLPEAATSYQTIATLDPNYLDEVIDNGFSLSHWNRVVDYLQYAALTEADNADHHFRLGFTLRALGNWQLAARSFEQALHLNPNHQLARYWLAQTHTQTR